MKKVTAQFVSKVLTKSARLFVTTNKVALSSPKAPKELRTSK